MLHTVRDMALAYVGEIQDARPTGPLVVGGMCDGNLAAIEIAREAGQVLLAHRGVTFELKGDYDLVTAADKASEKLIISRLRERFPDHGIVAEEGGRGRNSQ